jgi:hypothetical protein
MCWKHKRTVAFLDTGNNDFRTMERKHAEKIPHTVIVSLPRFASKTDICEKDSKDKEEDQFLATLHLWRLGLSYNLGRWLRPSSEIYVKKSVFSGSRNSLFNPED